MYTTTFTEAELKQMAVFYASPAGQKSLEKLPELMQRTAMAGARLSQPHSDELRAAMAARSEELKKENGGRRRTPVAPAGRDAGKAPGRRASALRQAAPAPKRQRRQP